MVCGPLLTDGQVNTPTIPNTVSLMNLDDESYPGFPMQTPYFFYHSCLN